MSSHWYACSEPERPTDPYVVWHYHSCEPCHIKARVVESMHPDNQHVQWLVGMTNPASA